MLIDEYIEERKATKTYQARLLIFEKYKIKSKWGGLGTVVPPLPKADDEHHVIALDFNGIYPRITTVLSDKQQNIKTNELSNCLFVFVKINPPLLHIPSPEGGYQLGDGDKINATIDVTYKINDVREFWLNTDDPVAMFERSVVNEARKYFFSITSNYFINKSLELKSSLEAYITEQHDIDSEIKRIKESLEMGIKNRCAAPGIDLIKVYADVQLSQKINEHLGRLHERFYKPDGIFEGYYSLQEQILQRNNINREIDKDETTFNPYSLRKVITALDVGLIENFYKLPWSDAIQKVHDEIRRRKNSYLSDYKIAEIEGIQKNIKEAEKSGLQDVHIEELKSKLFRAMNNDQEYGPLFTDRKFLQLVMTQQIEVDKTTGQEGNYKV